MDLCCLYPVKMLFFCILQIKKILQQKQQQQQ